MTLFFSPDLSSGGGLVFLFLYCYKSTAFSCVLQYVLCFFFLFLFFLLSKILLRLLLLTKFSTFFFRLLFLILLSFFGIMFSSLSHHFTLLLFPFFLPYSVSFSCLSERYSDLVLPHSPQESLVSLNTGPGQGYGHVTIVNVC